LGCPGSKTYETGLNRRKDTSRHASVEYFRDIFGLQE
jgi:hypothetical protein